MDTLGNATVWLQLPFIEATFLLGTYRASYKICCFRKSAWSLVSACAISQLLMFLNGTYNFNSNRKLLLNLTGKLLNFYNDHQVFQNQTEKFNKSRRQHIDISIQLHYIGGMISISKITNYHIFSIFLLQCHLCSEKLAFSLLFLFHQHSLFFPNRLWVVLQLSLKGDIIGCILE